MGSCLLFAWFADSTTRSLYSAYSGKLYQLKRTSTNATMDILAVSGFPDVAAHDKFCAAAEEVVDPNCPPYARPCYAPVLAACVMSIIYDQTGNGNHLLPATPAVSNPLHYDMPVNATRHPVLLGGRKVYGAWFDQGNGYRAQNTSKVAVDNEPETICESSCLSSVHDLYMRV